MWFVITSSPQCSSSYNHQAADSCTADTAQRLDSGSTIVGADIAAALILVIANTKSSGSKRDEDLSKRDLTCMEYCDR